MTEIILHIGMHKTGTTFIQEEVFQRLHDTHDDINYIETFNIDTPIKENQINIISDENLDGGSYRLPSHHIHRDTIAKNLSKLYPNAKVILCIRDKDKWIRSAYNQYVLGYGAKERTFEEYTWVMDPEITNYDGYIKLLKSLFKKVYICKFEDLKNNPAKFIMNLCDFMGTDYPLGVNYKRKNVSLKSYQIKAIRLISKFLYFKELYFPISVLIKLIRKDVKFGKWGRKI